MHLETIYALETIFHAFGKFKPHAFRKYVHAFEAGNYISGMDKVIQEIIMHSTILESENLILFQEF